MLGNTIILSVSLLLSVFLIIFPPNSYCNFTLCNLNALVTIYFFACYVSLSTHTNTHSHKFLTLFNTNSYIHLLYMTQTQVTKYTHPPQKLHKKIYHNIFHTILNEIVICATIIAIPHKQLLSIYIRDIHYVRAATTILLKNIRYE